MTSRAEILLHPVRMRIVQVISASTGPSTARQLADALPDVPPATLYRHLGLLVEAGMLDVVEVRPVRGASEKLYALPDIDGPLLRRDATAEEHFRAFLSHVAGQLSSFSRYLEQGAPDPHSDGITYHTTALHLSDDEHTALLTQLEALLGDAAHPPAPGRRLRLITVQSMLAMDEPSGDED